MKSEDPKQSHGYVILDEGDRIEKNETYISIDNLLSALKEIKKTGTNELKVQMIRPEWGIDYKTDKHTRVLAFLFDDKIYAIAPISFLPKTLTKNEG